MAAPRRFDHERACELFATGEWTLTALAQRYGVTPTAVKLVVDPVARARGAARTALWRREGQCPSCGVQTTRQSKRASRRCRACFSKARRKKLKLTVDQGLAVTCGHCGEMKPLTEYGPRVSRALAAGRAPAGYRCRACDTAARRAYRDSVKVPCRNCGGPCLPQNETGATARGLNPTGLCLTCYRASRHPAPCVHDWRYDAAESAGPWTGYIERCVRCNTLRQVPQ